MRFLSTQLHRIRDWDASLAAIALMGMVLIPVMEVFLRPFQGSGIENAPVLVQHLGLLFSLAGALYAERTGHLTSLGSAWEKIPNLSLQKIAKGFVFLFSTCLCVLLCKASFDLMLSEVSTGHTIAYGLPTWAFLSTMPIAFALLGLKFGMRWHGDAIFQWVGLVAVSWMAWHLQTILQDMPLMVLLLGLALVLFLLLGGSIFLVLGGLSWVLFLQENIPMASLALSHYQITVNPSLPALPLFTLAGLIFANTQAANRLSVLFSSIFGGGRIGTILAVACLCSCFTALTGGSGVTILALGGLMLPLLNRVNYPETKSIGLITSASALGVLLAPSVPLIMYAIMARVPIQTMFVAGLLPAVLMIICLILFGRFLNIPANISPIKSNSLLTQESLSRPKISTALWDAKWEVMTPFVAIAGLISGLTTPTEGAALTVAYAIFSQALVHRELHYLQLKHCLIQSAQVIGGILLIMGMALGLTNYLIDVGIPDLASDWVQSITTNKYVFLLALNVFLFFAGALMEIYAAIVVLVPLLLPLAMSYGIDPIHFGIIFLANLEMGFLCPPAGMNIYFASAVFKKSISEVVRSVLPALGAIFIGTVILSWFPIWVTALPQFFLSTSQP